MGKKLYEPTEEGGIKFETKRKPGEVRVPNYVYDLWLPLLGADAIAVYSVYCRLEMAGTVKRASLQTLADACRIGVRKLNIINAKLEECGFIKAKKPEGYKRLMHWTTEITVLDPPRVIAPMLIEKYAPKRGYEPLTPWLVKEDENTNNESQMTFPQKPSDISGEAKQPLDTMSDDMSNIATLCLQPSDVEETAPDGDGFATIDGHFKQVVRLYENTIGTINAHIGERLQDLADEYPLEWIEDAFKAATDPKIKNKFAYVEEILQRKNKRAATNGASRADYPEQARMLEQFGVKAPGGDLLKLPPEYIKGWIAETLISIQEGEQDAKYRVGRLVQDLRYGADVPPRAQVIAALTPDDWRDLLMCVKATRQRSFVTGKRETPPLDYVSEQAREAWSVWASLFTVGESQIIKKRFELKAQDELAIFVGVDTLANLPDVDTWLEEKRCQKELA